VKKVSEELFTGNNVRSHLRALQAQIELMKSNLSEYGEASRTLKRLMSEELITSIISRFEKNEERIKNLDVKLDSINFDIKEKLSQEIRIIRNELVYAKQNEERVNDLEEKIDFVQFEVREKIPQEIRKIRNDLSDAQLSKAIACILKEKEIKVDSKPLDELKKEYEV
jgi:tetrahydromethanopterin S-methyltransferase subunit G